MELQIAAAEAEANDEEFMQEIKRWVRVEDSNEKQLVTQSKPVRKWWWTNQHGALMISLKDGNKIIPLDDQNISIEVGGIEDLVSTLETIRSAVIAGELDASLEKLIGERKLPKKKTVKAANK